MNGGAKRIMGRSTGRAEDYWIQKRRNHESEDTGKLDSEAELGVVMGRKTSHIAMESRGRK